jgi:hypothetical protein
MLDKSITGIPGKAKAQTPPSTIENEVNAQADKAAEASPAVRGPSKTHSILPATAYAGPRTHRSYAPKADGRISARDTLPRRYLNLIARPEGCDENTGRRVNVNCGPTRGGFARYTAQNTGIAIVYNSNAYRVGQYDKATGNYVLASDEYRKEVYEATGGETFTETVVKELGPDFTKVVPPAPTKEAVAV